MSEEPVTPGLVELLRRADDAADRHDIDALMSFYAPDAVWDMSAVGIGVFEGAGSIRRFFEEWWATWEEHDREVEEVRDFGRGIVFGAVREHGRLIGSDKRVEHTRGWVAQWAGGVTTKVTLYLGADEARAAAERLAKEPS
jgi:ketosteroid isomerase-like protein